MVWVLLLLLLLLLLKGLQQTVGVAASMAAH
jgi:hypothetical protein